MNRQLHLATFVVGFFISVLPPVFGQTPASDAQKQPINPPLRGKQAAAVTADMLPHSTERVIIPELTEVPVILKDEIQSGANKIGSELLFFVARDVYGPGHKFLIAKGTPAIGHIAESRKNGSFGRAGKLVLTCDYILAQDKTRILLRGVQQERRGEALNGLAASIAADTTVLEVSDGIYGTTIKGGGELARGALGGVIGLGIGTVIDLFVSGNDAKLHIGKTYDVYVNSDTQTDLPTPNLDNDSATSVGDVFIVLKDGGFAFGKEREVEGGMSVTNSAGTTVINPSDIVSIQPIKDASRTSN
jgi:hypothetical protein